MREAQFDESLLNDPQAIAALLFDDPSDPRSWSYKRQLVRPKIHWFRIILFVTAWVLSALATYYCVSLTGVHFAISLAAALMEAILVIFFFAKRIVLCLVRIYQRYAPASLRNKCRFEPSCSQYMILSIEKYGLRKGYKKGIHRLKRCNTDGGGFDFP